MPEFEVSASRSRASGDQLSDAIDDSASVLGADMEAERNPLDTPEARTEHSKLLSWFYGERDRQGTNRLEMALDHDFYDSLQWSEEDKDELASRGQMPLVYNEVAPMVDWLIGTERRTRVDWKVLPRSEDDVQDADIKTKVLKYVSDINRVPFARSRAFTDAVKGGVGWLDDGARDDPTQDVLYSKYEDWRNVLWDSMSYELDLSDARYVFRWRWVDLDIAEAMFPDRADEIRRASSDIYSSAFVDDDTLTSGGLPDTQSRSGTVTTAGSVIGQSVERLRVKLIECQYRKPSPVKIIADGPLKGQFVHEHDQVMQAAIANNGYGVIDRVMLRVHIAVFTETSMISWAPSVFRHNRFSLTPIWCYRRNRDRLPYGAVRRVRDIQQDLNKRASKALFLLNTNQIIADDGAVEDWEDLRNEVDRPDGVIIKKAGKQLEIRRDTDAATGQIQMMTLAAQSIQRGTGISNENLGRQTNAASGEAIVARQQQGSVVTTEPFDNLRFAVQVQGEKQLSLTEQFYTEEKVIRLTGTKGRIEWLRVNQPEQQPDGSYRILNDITRSQADFVVSEQDYAGTLRQVLFEQLTQVAGRLPPEVALRILTMAMEFSDLPNKDEIAEQIRKITGDRDPSKEPTPEEAQQIQQQEAMQQEAMQMQREQALTALQEQKAKVAKLNAEAEEILARAQAHAAGGGDQQGDAMAIEQAVNQVRQQAQAEIDALSQQLRQLQNDMSLRTMQIDREADTKLEIARIDADTKTHVAQIAHDSSQHIQALTDQLAELRRELAESKQEAKQAVKDSKPADAAGTSKANGAESAAKAKPAKKFVKVVRDDAGKIVGAEVTQDQE